MDDRDDLQQDETTEAESHTATGPKSDRVRIVGVETAGEATGKVPAVRANPIQPGDTVQPGGAVRPAGSGEPPSAVQPLGTDWRRDPRDPEESAEPAVDSAPWSVPWSSQPPPPLFDEPEQSTGDDAYDPDTPVESDAPLEEAPSPDVSALPHWTEPPTGQVPAVLARDTEDGDDWRTRSGPTWREEHSDWTAHDDQFDPDLYANEETALGSLDEKEGPDPIRRPWEFDLPSDTGRMAPIRLSGEPVVDPRDPGAPAQGDFDYEYEDEKDQGSQAPANSGTPPYSTINPVTEVVPAVGADRPRGSITTPMPSTTPRPSLTTRVSIGSGRWRNPRSRSARAVCVAAWDEGCGPGDPKGQ